MAGISIFPFKLFHTTITPSPLFSSSHSKFFGLLLSNPYSLKSHSSLPLPAYVTARYGGGPRTSDSGNSRRRHADSEDEQALDLSSLKSDTVRLIDQNQNMVGVVSLDEAVQMAEDAELDLVILSPDADPPVVRIMNYSKYRYEQQKKKRGQQKKSAANRMDLKELKMGYNIDQHDYSVRLKAARKFLKDGDKIGVEEAKNFRDRNVFIVLVPNKAAVQKTQETPKKRDKSAADEVSVSVQS
ncbi:translation initiation factor IF3-4, chloroplastic-like isoform X2 [Abrus precatorius]|uniref:Translation initiation factor IF-3 n=1 Tax=Abrus precatorius TaxID=3816 RepID=A0A8B8JKF6_ABRPR|nr:translation initiation factor IF3-4, chloroplastic-like isoform X2 [Abrus precatorius]